MFDHVDRRRVLEQPSRKDLAPGQLAFGIRAFLNKNLHKGPGFGRAFPRQGAFAGGQTDNHVADALRLARLQDNVLRDVVPLVQQAQRGHAILHRGAILALYGCRRNLRTDPLRNFSRRSIGITAAIASRQQQDQTGRKQAPHGQASGLQAS